MKIHRISIAIVFTIIFAAAASAQTNSKTTQMLEEVAGKTADIASYKVDTKMESQMMGQAMIMNGEMAFKKPNKMHMKTTSNMMGGMTQEIFTSGDIVWTYMPMMKMATKMDLSKMGAQNSQRAGMADQADITKPFAGFPKENVKYIETKKVGGREVYVFEATPDFGGQMPPGQPTPQMFPEKIIFWLDADTGLPSKVTMVGKDGKTMMEQTYSNFRINIPIDDSEFEFTPPEGVQVMDMTEGALNMMKQMQGSGAKSE